MKISYISSFFILLANLTSSTVNALQVSCTLLNDSYLENERKMIVAKPVSLTPNYQDAKVTIFSDPTIEILLASAVIVEHSVSKPFVSAFDTIIVKGEEATRIRSSIRDSATDSMGSHITLQGGKKSLLVTCDSISN
ncbi:hypothetical protein EKN09_28240 [Vibrio penaeicida]|uniref:Adhesin n=1 Tax=Vibrio penaeicida TaxID=104609 RepID=A0AAV5NVZ7_9VIBR|nr:hypothetical protein [Vibrio penaeicida]RTZ19145.1 hypothetical protein EKN09_28240 [Vibrio penaeicida]GLQ74237.1 hypothetical protein GCM10007932_35980 [Vibrio penaeicida]